MLTTIVAIILNFIPIMLAIILHEIAHGYAALKLGDNTAKRFGRLSLNPIKHIDLFGTIILPALLYASNVGFIFGWARPVPVNYAKINSRRDMLIVASAGIVMNIALAILSAIILLVVDFISSPLIHGILEMFFVNMVVYNIILAVFNILPFPPMDGSKIFFGGISQTWAQRYIFADKVGLTTFFAVAIILPLIGNLLGQNWNIVGWYVMSVSKFFISALI